MKDHLRKIKHNVSLYLHSVAEGVSDKAMDKLKSIIRVMALRHGFDLPLSNTYRRTRYILESSYLELFTISRFTYKIPAVFLNEGVLRPKIFEGHFLNIMVVLCDMLLQITVEDMHLRPFVQVTEEGVPYLGEPATSPYFKLLFDYTQATYGEDVFPIPICISSDDLALNKTGSRGAKPVYMNLASRTAKGYWDTRALRCVGFAPASIVSGV